ncbi:unnamed protein product, partial [Rotaria sp. Silwood1]
MIGMNQMKITGEIQGLPIHSKFSIHVHEFGDLTNSSISIVGDEFGNLQVNQEGQAKIDVIDKRLTLFSPSSTIGRSVVIIDEKEEELARVETEENKGTTTVATNRIAADVI